eukprot:4101015-Pyramimonas_sp.AAC.1
MVVNIGTAVTSIAQVMNTGQANPAWQMGDPWYESPAGAAGTGSSGSEQPAQSAPPTGQPPAAQQSMPSQPAQPPQSYQPLGEQDGLTTTGTTTTSATTAGSLYSIPEEESPAAGWEVLSDMSDISSSGPGT